jgi:2-phosphosulfolactate phosphatase
MIRQLFIDIGPPCRHDPALFGPEDAVVVIDVIRATTTAITAIATGRRCFPVPSREAAAMVARRLAKELERPLLVGELGGERPFGFHLTNSPAKVARRSDIGRPMVLLSSSGTRLLHHVKDAGAVYLACLRNRRTAAEHLAAHHARVFIIGAATRGAFREEDQLCCAYVAEMLMKSGFDCEDRNTERWVARWSSSPIEAILQSDSVAYLRSTGQIEDLEFILHHVDDLASAYRLRGGEVEEVDLGTSDLVASTIRQGESPCR